jgi:hypothetical protein
MGIYCNDGYDYHNGHIIGMIIIMKIFIIIFKFSKNMIRAEHDISLQVGDPGPMWDILSGIPHHPTSPIPLP